METKRKKVLIIKLGYSEFLQDEVTRTCSLGDVFRTTVILHLYKEDHVTWLTDRAAVPLLKDNPYIDRIMTLDLLNVLQLEGERFDLVINLEKVPGLCAMVDRMNAWKFFGYRFDEETGSAKAYDLTSEALTIATQEDAKRLNKRSWDRIIYDVLGARWDGESYILGYRPGTEPRYDLGFNDQVGEKYPVKRWPDRHWRTLEGLMGDRYTITNQQSLNDLYGYIDWINTCRTLVTNDSLGLYLGIALEKKVVVLVGPTSATELSPHENLRILTPTVDRDCIPCFKSDCALGETCMEYIEPQAVYEAIEANYEG